MMGATRYRTDSGSDGCALPRASAAADDPSDQRAARSAGNRAPNHVRTRVGVTVGVVLGVLITFSGRLGEPRLRSSKNQAGCNNSRGQTPRNP